VRARRKLILLWVVVAGILLCFGAPLALMGQQLRQESLNWALVQAVKRLDAPAVSRLLDEGASANAIDACEPPLTLPNLLKRLLARVRHEPKGVADGERKSILAVDLTLGDLDRPNSRIDVIAAMLINHGADVDLRDVWLMPPIHIAAYRGLHQTVRTLLSRGADVDARDRYDRTPLMVADAESTKLLVENGANVNAMSSGGCSPLMVAANSDNVEVARTLILHGADVNATDRIGFSILYYTEAYGGNGPGTPALIRLLKQHGARLNENDKKILPEDGNLVPVPATGPNRDAPKRLPSRQTHHGHQARRTTEAQ